ncbi:hypothetical protein M8J77_009816 [Diaphorina citri]|nr:hypothetical protein M8J77_009816 [Diaphorina citri]
MWVCDCDYTCLGGVVVKTLAWAYECACFDGFSGPDCGNGPLCRSGQNVCENGARCRHAGSTHVLCECPDGYSGARCEILPPAPHSTQNNMDCSPEFDPSCSDTGTPPRPLCPYSGDSEPPCICDENEAVPVLYASYFLQNKKNICLVYRVNLDMVLQEVACEKKIPGDREFSLEDITKSNIYYEM